MKGPEINIKKCPVDHALFMIYVGFMTILEGVIMVLSLGLVRVGLRTYSTTQFARYVTKNYRKPRKNS